MYSSGGQNRAGKSRKIEAAVVGTPSNNSFFKMQDSSADINVAAAVVENTDTGEEANVSPFCPIALKTFKK